MKTKILSLIIVFFMISTVFVTGFVSAIDKVVYPLYASDTCDISHSIFKTDSSAAQTLTQTKVTYTCKSNSVCRVRNPTVTCNYPKSISNLWLGYTGYWTINVKGYTYKASVSSDKSVLSQGVEFNEGDSVTYSGVCVNNGIRSLAGLILGSLFGDGLTAPTTSSLNIEVKAATIWHDPALEGAYTVTGTEYCQYNSALREYADNLPTNSVLGKTSAELAQTGASSVSGNPTQELSDETRFYIGTSKLSVDKYIDLPFLYNVNPLGKFEGKDIICSQSKGIISVVPLSTEGGDTYYVLGSRLKNSGFCCSNQECKSSYGNNYNCEASTYTCKEIEGYCNNDLDCQPAGGTMYDTNCYQKSGKFYTWSSKCQKNLCTPYPVTTTEVKCCPGYCALTNQVCDTSKGCYTPTTPLPDCPAGMCCDGTTTKAAGCSTGQVCCYEADLHKGYCKTSCVSTPECTKESDCETGKTCENNKCIAIVSSQNKEECIAKAAAQPLMGWEWVDKTSEQCGFWCSIGIGKPKTINESYCKSTFIIYWILLGTAIVVFGWLITYFVVKRKKAMKSAPKVVSPKKPGKKKTSGAKPKIYYYR